MNEDAQVAADARAEAIRSGCQDPEARRIVAVYSARRATPAISADDIEQEAWLDILRTLHRRHDPTVATVPKHIAGLAYNAVRTAARNLERRAGLAQEKRMGIVRVPADEVDGARVADAVGDRQVLLTRIGDVRDTLPPDLAEEIDRYLTGERSLGRRERRAAVQALREALRESSARASRQNLTVLWT
jgi:DNA-directed RNA polymerase specialized sigma24 family protein